MKSVITIEDTDKGVAVTIESEAEPGKYVTSKHLFDMVLDAVKGRFRPIVTYFRPVRKARARR